MVYHKIDINEAQVGDFMKFPERDRVDITVGTYYEIIEVDSDGDYVYKDDVNDFRFAIPSLETFEVYERVAE